MSRLIIPLPEQIGINVPDGNFRFTRNLLGGYDITGPNAAFGGIHAIADNNGFFCLEYTGKFYVSLVFSSLERAIAWIVEHPDGVM